MAANQRKPSFGFGTSREEGARSVYLSEKQDAEAAAAIQRLRLIAADADISVRQALIWVTEVGLLAYKTAPAKVRRAKLRKRMGLS